MHKLTTLTAILFTTVCVASVQSAYAFDCRKAKNRAEHTVCGSSSLRYIDERLNSEYYFAKLYARSKWFKRQLVMTQRRWMQTRNRCGSSKSCLHRVYATRLNYLTDTYENRN